MPQYNIMLVLLGIAIMGVAWLPSLLEKYPLSYPILYVGLGMLVFALPLGLNSDSVDPLVHQSLTTHLTEICVIVALTGTGLKIDKPFSWRGWQVPLRLVIPLMVLTIGAVAVSSWLLVPLIPAAAVLLAASLAPTDPVLAGDVQVGDPGEGKEDAVRFALTGEAGLNDGLAFPFVHLAIALLPAAAVLHERLWHWFWMDVLYRTAAGLLLGWLSGKLLAYLIFNLPKQISIKAGGYGFVALAMTLITYGVTELAQVYGFLAVFVAALQVRAYERNHEYHKHMHSFTDQLERVLIVTLLILFGGSLVNGLLTALTWQGAVTGLLLLLLIRPLGGMLMLLGTRTTLAQRWAVSSFGIRGIGSFFYLAYAIEKADFPMGEQLWAIIGFVVLLSVVLHGTLATPVMNWLDRRYHHKD
jgi:NhaP-type Na+/H+ or K+/H+ antiporter